MDKVKIDLKRYCKYWIAGTVIGALFLIACIMLFKDDPARIWANLWLNGILFLFFGLGAMFFWTVHILGNSGWHTSIQRIPEAMALTIPFAGLLLILSLPGMQHIFHWTHIEHADPILEAKAPFLNIPFWLIRFVLYFICWSFFAITLRKLSLKLDISSDLAILKKIRVTSGWFIVFFAITSSVFAWDWLMSIDPHWFSTLYGWYIFSGMFVSALAMIILLAVFLKTTGVMSHITDEHLHDLGKYLFGFSIFWAYLWLSQYLLIWYSNIPEESIYYVQRLEDYKIPFYINVALNFGVPFILLMTRSSKRQPVILACVAVILLAGHWLDLYLAIMPGIFGENHIEINFAEIGLPILYLAIFFGLFLRNFSKAAIVPEKHPYLQESFEYENL